MNPQKDETVWLHLTSGRGPEECCIAVNGILKIIESEANSLGLSSEILETTDSKYGLLSALIRVEGEGASAFANSWFGTVLWICPSTLRPEHGRKRWFIGVSAAHMLAPIDDVILEKDLVWTAMKASGPGGQHVNKTESAVRLLHKPSDVVVTAQEEKSQHRNKALARVKLKHVLKAREEGKLADAAQDLWSHHNDLERGKPVRTYQGTDFKKIS